MPYYLLRLELGIVDCSYQHTCVPADKDFDMQQVLGKAFEIISYLVANSTVGKKDAFTAMGGLVEKMSDIKLKNPAGEAMFAISEALGPQFTITQLHKKASAHKNPKVDRLDLCSKACS